MRVLYVSHTGRIGGGERSLLDLLTALPASVSASVACAEGPLAAALRDGGVDVHVIPGTDGSLRLHPRHSSQAVLELGRAAIRVRRLAGRLGADLVHANSIRAGIVGSLAARLGGPPTIVHVRDCLPPGPASEATLRLIAGSASAVVANSNYTAGSLMRSGARWRAPVRVVHNAVDLGRFDPAVAAERSEVRARLGLDPAAAILAVVAQITPWKGQVDAVHTVARVKRRRPEVRLLLVGAPTFVSKATRYDNQAYLGELERLIAAEGVGEEVLLLGEREDVPDLLTASDVLLLPSWEEPFGRAVLEAMAMGVPVLATNVGGPAELIRDGLDGLVLPPRQPERWATAIETLIEQPQLRAEMGRHGRERAAQFGIGPHLNAILSVYGEVLGADRP